MTENINAIMKQIEEMEKAHPLQLTDKTSKYLIDTCWVFDGQCYETIIFGLDVNGNRTSQTFLIRHYDTEEDAITGHKSIVEAWG